jgi:Flp pilus assembly protein TadB
MKSEPRPAKREIPNPLLILAGVVSALTLFAISVKTTLLPRSYAIGLAIFIIVVFRWLSRRSAKAARIRREQELEQLRHKRVLGLDD